MLARDRPQVAIAQLRLAASAAELRDLHRRVPDDPAGGAGQPAHDRANAGRCSPSAPPRAWPRAPRRATSCTPSTWPRAGCTCCRQRRSTTHDPVGPDLLTPREAEVLELLRSGALQRRDRRTRCTSASRPCAPTRGGSTASSASGRGGMLRAQPQRLAIRRARARVVEHALEPPGTRRGGVEAHRTAVQLTAIGARARAEATARRSAPRWWPRPCAGCRSRPTC